ncbi:MAG: ATP-binding cassette domain-containing protein [Planctomycetaceae bacterium]
MLLDISNLTIELLDPGCGEYVPVVRDFSLQLPKGRIVGITGRSGSGKSTLARALNGTLPLSARVRISELRLLQTKVTPDVETQYISAEEWNLQILSAYGGNGFSVQQDAQSVLVPFRSVGWHFRQARRTGGGLTIRQMARAAELSEAQLSAFPRQLNTGHCQRVQLMLATQMRPKVLIADEPFASLNPAARHEFSDRITALASKNSGIVLISHDLDVLKRCCHDVLVMANGRSAESGPADHVFERPGHPQTQTLLALSSNSAESCRVIRRQVTPDDTCCFADVCHVHDKAACAAPVPTAQKWSDGRTVVCDRVSEYGQPVEPNNVDECEQMPADRENPDNAVNVLQLTDVSRIFTDSSGPGLLRHLRGRTENPLPPGLINRSLALPARGRVCLRGRNGIGKTTLARIAVGLEESDSGEVLRLGQPDLTGNLDHIGRRRLWRQAQLVYQDSDVSFDPNQSVLDCIREVWEVEFSLSAEQCRNSASRLLAEFGLSDRLLDRTTVLLSGGERRRLSIARALAVFGFVTADEWLTERDEPRFVILDEPTVGLDMVMQKVVIRVLKAAQIRRNLAYLVISHDDAFTDKFCEGQIQEWT